jgi:hypothetical protein
MNKVNRYRLTHRETGQYLATKSANSVEEAISSLLQERGYDYYNSSVIDAELLGPIDTTDWKGKRKIVVKS